MNRFVCGVFTWQELSSTNRHLVPRLRRWEFVEEGWDVYLEFYHKDSWQDEIDFCLALDLGDEAGPRVTHFYGHLPEVYCNDRFELSSKLDVARDKLLGAVIRKVITEAVTKEAV